MNTASLIVKWVYICLLCWAAITSVIRESRKPRGLPWAYVVGHGLFIALVAIFWQTA